MRTIALTVSVVLLCLAPVTAVADTDSLVLGVYELERNTGVVDGDTIRCWKLDGGVRLLCIDAEENFRELEDRRAAGRNWEAYAAEKSKANDLPVKYGTFMGEEATHWARDFFRGVKSVRLEYDTLNRKKDIYGRHLCYAFATLAGSKEEKNFCVELVREGYSPYSMKYGHSARFRKEFEKAEKEARAAKRGIWAEKPMGYRDYDARCKWWLERGEQLVRYEKEHSPKTHAIALTEDSTADRLSAHVGREVLLLCNMPEFKDGIDHDGLQISFTATQDTRLNLHFADADQLKASGADDLRGYYVLVKGKLERDGRNWKVALLSAEHFTKP